MQLSEHDKEVIRAFASYIDAHYEIFEPEDDGYTLYSDMKYHSTNEVVEEYFNKQTELELEK